MCVMTSLAGFIFTLEGDLSRAERKKAVAEFLKYWTRKGNTRKLRFNRGSSDFIDDKETDDEVNVEINRGGRRGRGKKKKSFLKKKSGGKSF